MKTDWHGARSWISKTVGRCNGSAALCDKRLNEVVFVGTHNSMSADGEPGWLFAAQDAGIDAQLDDGVRSLLIDTHYGFATPRGVATSSAPAGRSRAGLATAPRGRAEHSRIQTPIQAWSSTGFGW